LQAYDHVQRAADFRVELQAVHEEMQRRERSVALNLDSSPGGPKRELSTPLPGLSASSEDLAFLLGEDDDN
jgi:hypothetical protein